MDPLAALSLAGTVCQLVDFAGKVLREGKQIYSTGTSLNVQHLSLVTGDLKKLLSSLEHQCRIHTQPNHALGNEDQVCQTGAYCKTAE